MLSHIKHMSLTLLFFSDSCFTHCISITTFSLIFTFYKTEKTHSLIKQFKRLQMCNCNNTGHVVIVEIRFFSSSFFALAQKDTFSKLDVTGVGNKLKNDLGTSGMKESAQPYLS